MKGRNEHKHYEKNSTWSLKRLRKRQKAQFTNQQDFAHEKTTASP